MTQKESGINAQKYFAARSPEKSGKSIKIIFMPLNVLGYQDDDKEWVALALEMDLRGYGKTFDDAFADLKEIVNEQVLFAIHKEDFGLLQHRAEDHYFRMFREAKENALRQYLEVVKEPNNRINNSHQELGTIASYLDLPDPHVIASQRVGYSPIGHT